MDELMAEYLDMALRLEEKNYVDEAIDLYDRLLDIFPDSTKIILTEKAKLEFRNMREKEALLDFIRIYAISRDKEIYDLVLEAYLNPNLKELEERYQKNVLLLQEYPFYRNDFEEEEVDVYALWMDEETLCVVNMEEKTFGILQYSKHKEQKQEEAAFMLINQLCLPEIFYCKARMKKDSPFLDMEIPYYLVYDRNYWFLFMQIVDMEKLIMEKRAVFLIGEKSFCAYFEDLYAMCPQIIINCGAHSSYENLLERICEEKAQEEEKYKKENKEYYQERGQTILQNLQRGKPRILFWTSRFTTALQYHTKNSMQAAQRLGCETRLLIEPDGIHRVYNVVYCKCIAEFHPDIIFCIDHFRFENFDSSDGLDGIVWVTWVQDPLAWIMDVNTPKKLGTRDIVLNHMVTSKDFLAIGYDKRRLIDAPIPADSHTYQMRELSFCEREAYGCDICFVCHTSDVSVYMEESVQRYPKELQDSMREVYRGYQRYVYETGNVFYTEEEFRLYVDGALKQHFQMAIRPELLHIIAKEMLLWLNQRVYRQALVDWLLDAGVSNLKLWGNGWRKEPKYAKYAMGAAENGETLSKIYQSSKIVIGNNVLCTNAARVWESMLSGAFYLGNYVPPEIDHSDIRVFIKPDEELAMFYDKEDFIKKVDYYLTHEEERQRMIKIGQEIALREMTFDSLMRKTIREIPGRVTQLGERSGDGR